MNGYSVCVCILIFSLAGPGCAIRREQSISNEIKHLKAATDKEARKECDDLHKKVSSMNPSQVAEGKQLRIEIFELYSYASTPGFASKVGELNAAALRSVIRLLFPGGQAGDSHLSLLGLQGGSSWAKKDALERLDLYPSLVDEDEEICRFLPKVRPSEIRVDAWRTIQQKCSR